jgi:hypothetical protein
MLTNFVSLIRAALNSNQGSEAVCEALLTVHYGVHR